MPVPLAPYPAPPAPYTPPPSNGIFTISMTWFNFFIMWIVSACLVVEKMEESRYLPILWNWSKVLIVIKDLAFKHNGFHLTKTKKRNIKHSRSLIVFKEVQNACWSSSDFVSKFSLTHLYDSTRSISVHLVYKKLWFSAGAQSQLVCSGCRNLLLYPVGATSVCCAVCNAVTAVPPPGMLISLWFRRFSHLRSVQIFESWSKFGLLFRPFSCVIEQAQKWRSSSVEAATPY